MPSKRLDKFESFKEHIVQGKLYRKLTQSELKLCREFIGKHDGLDRNAFADKCNKWMLGEPKPKNHTTMWALVLQSN
jgi:hypothetical protein